jgi:adenylate cyclase
MVVPSEVEVERKWLLFEPPPLELCCTPVEITQAYLVTEPGELRIRRKGERCFITAKGDGSLARGEWEVELPDWVFEQLLVSAGCVISKTRYLMMGQGPVTLEVDVFSGVLEGLFLVEAEWTGTKEQQEELTAIATAYQLPDVLGTAVDVTDDPRYKNKKLGARGIPQ